MKKMKRMSIVVILVVASLFVVSQSTFASGWGSYTTTITGFYVWSTANAHFKVANMENPDNCSNPGYLTLDANATHFKELYATLMTAYTAGKTIRLYYGGCNSSGYPLIGAIAVPNVW